MIGDFMLVKIGERIKSIRLEKGLKLQDLAEMSGISKGMLSKIENARSIPSLPVLMTVLATLKTDPGDFFNGIPLQSGQSFIHKKKEDYTTIEKEDAVGFVYRQILSKNLKNLDLEVVLLKLEPKSQRDKVVTDGFEFKYMLQGEMEYQIGEEFITLQEGDSLFFDGRIPHVPINRTDKDALVLVMYFLSN